MFRHPFTMLLAGPTSCGKTTWMKHLLQQAEIMIKPPLKRSYGFTKDGNQLTPNYKKLFLILNLFRVLDSGILMASLPCTSMTTL